MQITLHIETTAYLHMCTVEVGILTDNVNKKNVNEIVILLFFLLDFCVLLIKINTG